MGYVAVKGGTAAIEESIKRLHYQRIKGKKIIEVDVIKNTMRGLIDKIMSEGSLYSKDLAALAIKQAEGNPEEAAFLVRAFRSTLPRVHYSRVVEPGDMRIERRISAAFKDIPGGQILGACVDYTHRLLDFGLYDETLEKLEKWLKEYDSSFNLTNMTDINGENSCRFFKVLEALREEGLIAKAEGSDAEPKDITRSPLEFPAARSARLQTLTRGESGAVTALGYAAIRGYGAVHPTVGELRVGYLSLYIDYPFADTDDPEDALFIGEIQVTEVETLIPHMIEKAAGKKELQFSIGYGICYGQNETKAIAMSILDNCLENPHIKSPLHDEEFVLMHIDCVEASGFISHLKLPHYVTFQSELDTVRRSRKQRGS